MKCAVHPEVDVSGYCRNCGKPMCPACVRPVHDVLYCEECLAQVMGVPGPQAANPSATTGTAGYSGRTCSGRASSEAGCRESRACVHTGIYSGTGSNLQRRIQQSDYCTSLSLPGLIMGVAGLSVKDWKASGSRRWWLSFSIWPIDALRTAKSRQTGETPEGSDRDCGARSNRWVRSF